MNGETKRTEDGEFVVTKSAIEQMVDEIGMDDLERKSLEQSQRVVTVRMNALEHRLLIRLSHKAEMSINKYCKSKIIPGWVDPADVPVDPLAKPNRK